MAADGILTCHKDQREQSTALPAGDIREMSADQACQVAPMRKTMHKGVFKNHKALSQTKGNPRSANFNSRLRKSNRPP